MTTFVPPSRQKVVKVSVQQKENPKNSKNYQRPQPGSKNFPRQGKVPHMKRARNKRHGNISTGPSRRQAREEVKVVCLNSNVTMNVTSHYKSRDVTSSSGRRLHTIQIHHDDVITTSGDDYDDDYDVINDESDVEVAR